MSRSHMRFDILTLFPALVDSVLTQSIIGRARSAGKIDVRTHDIRDWTPDRWRRVDGAPAGGGRGMLMAAPPVWLCHRAAVSMQPENAKIRTVYLSPQGSVLTQRKAEELLAYDSLILLCGHYEGIDARVLDEIVDEEISVGDYVLTGGELPACILADCVSRMVDGVLPLPECYEEESIASGLMEYPQYTKPSVFHGKKIPDVLFSGDHEAVARWRYEESVRITREKRPSLLNGGVPDFVYKRSETYGTEIRRKDRSEE